MTDKYTLFEAPTAARSAGPRRPMPGVPNHWHVYFAIDGADATAAKAREAGGSVLVQPFDTPVGRIAVLQDPQGAVFSVIKTAMPTE